ncbi:hypothetical protein BHM03_00062682 [Ensete ventricosum]|uniref:Uncharacterized protein n=1 Tax=Ensete ventricosum TaxID=4639 RepID=A0A445MMY1_ENSVE|nr:hypothetical protein BHM03_00062682 [Ensete ventricosum]
MSSREREQDHHIVCATSESIREDEVKDDVNEDAYEKEEGPGDHCMSSAKQVGVHPLEAIQEALELVVNVGEAMCI